ESQSGAHFRTVLAHEHAALDSNAVLHGLRRPPGLNSSLVAILRNVRRRTGCSLRNTMPDYCETLVRKNDYDRYISALFAPEKLRSHLLALYALNYEIG